MKHITFYLDFISPYAYLAFERLPQVLQGLSYSVTYKPVLLAGLLKHHGQLGPAEIAPKRDWTYRQVLWLAQSHGVALQMPASHPFNSLALLRLALACDAQGTPNRHVTGTVLRHVWQGGADALDPARLDALRALLAEQLRPDEAAPERAKQLLRANTELAAQRGVFGVPMFEVDGHLFWGLDSLPMLRAYLDGDGWFAQHWQRCASVPQGLPG